MKCQGTQLEGLQEVEEDARYHQVYLACGRSEDSEYGTGLSQVQGEIRVGKGLLVVISQC